MRPKVELEGSKVRVLSDYAPTLPPQFRALGGKWDSVSKTWTFDARDEARVRRVLTEAFGAEGEPVATLRLKIDGLESYPGAELWLGGRLIARRADRDYPVRLGDGVIVFEGAFPRRGGSGKHPRLEGSGVVLEIRDVPVSLARAALAKEPGAYEIMSGFAR